MTNNHQTIIGTVAGAGTAMIKAAISLDGAIETAVYALIGAAVGFLATEGFKWVKNKITKQK